MPEFEDLPFFERPDLSPYLVHLTKNTRKDDDYSAYNNLVSILMNGKIFASGTRKGFIKGPTSATCFMDVPFYSLKYILNGENSDPVDPRYEAFGIFVTKKHAYRKGCSPVLYLSNRETGHLPIPKDELWRVVRFEADEDSWISWLHEREWRCKGDYTLPSDVGVLVKNSSYVERLQKRMREEPGEFRVRPRAVLPLTIMCQGLPNLPRQTKRK